MLRAKMRSTSNSQMGSMREIVESICDKDVQLKATIRRNMELKRQLDLSKQGRVLDVQALEPEFTLIKRLRLSESEQLRNLHAEFLRMTRPFPNPPKLDQDRCLARFLRFCLCIGQEKSVSAKSLERSLQEFKDALPSLMRKEEKR